MTAEETEKLLNGIAAALDVGLNGGRQEKFGFIVLVFPFAAEGGEARSVSNAAPDDIPDMLEHCAKNLRSQRKMLRGLENNSGRPN